MIIGDLIFPPKQLKIESLLDDERCQNFFKQLEGLEQINIFQLRGNSFGKQFFKELLPYLKKIHSIKMVILSDIFTSRTDEILDSLECLNEGLQNKQIELFDLSNNAICPDGCVKIKDILLTNQNMKFLILNHVALSQPGSVSIAQFMREGNLNLRVFEAVKNRIEIQATEFAKSLAQMSNLERLVIWQNNIKGKEMKELIESLKNCKKLKELDLSDNYLDDECIECLIELIKENKNLTKIRIGDCNVSVEGSELLAEFMASVENDLENFSYNYNEIDHISEFVKCFKNKQNFKKLEIKGICEEDDYERIREILPNVEVVFESECEDDEGDVEQQKIDDLVAQFKELSLNQVIQLQ